MMMKNMFVCMGSSSSTDTEAWVSQVKMSAETTVTSSLRPKSAVLSVRPPSGRPSSGRPSIALRPTSAYSSADADSGFWSAGRALSTYESSLDVASQRHGSMLSLVDEDTVDTPAPGPRSSLCIIEDTAPKAVKLAPHYNSDDDSDVTSVQSKISASVADDNANDVSELPNNDMLTDITDIKNVPDKAVPTEPEVPQSAGAYKPKSVKNNFELDIENTKNSLNQKDSDEDSLLNSDDDYDEERDQFFRQKLRQYPLTRRKGIEKFKKFLVGTTGEKNWNFWIDVERAKLISNNKQMTQ